MTRKNKLILNSALSLLYQGVMMICGFILPRFFLSYYGSEVNGLVTSITQFLGFIVLAECGIGPVVQASLYKPLAENDMLEVSKIAISSERFFRRIAFILVGYTIILMLIYPYIVIDSFDYIFTLVLIFVISISTFAQYYLGMTYRLILEADQLGFIQYSIHTATLILNTVSSILLMQFGAPIQFVKLMTSLIFVMQPVLLCIIAKHKYEIKRNMVLTEEPIKQKWSGLAQHIAGVVLVHTDVVVLTLFSTLENVSIYGVYHLIVNGLRQIVLSMTNGVRAMFGNMLAKNEHEELNCTFDRIEWLLHTLVTFVFSVAAVLTLPFVKIYTSDITDANYLIPKFAYMIVFVQAVYCLRLPYYILVNAAGHYKQTQMSAIIEAMINVVASVVLVFQFGLIGVALGTFAAMVYRTAYLVNYLTKNIIFRKISYFMKHLCVDVCSACLILLVVNILPDFFSLQALSYGAWILLAMKVAVTGLVIVLLMNIVFYHSKIRCFVQFLKNRKRSK